jgi:hypothetical protein
MVKGKKSLPNNDPDKGSRECAINLFRAVINHIFIDLPIFTVVKTIIYNCKNYILRL